MQYSSNISIHMGLKLVLYQLVGTIRMFLNQSSKSFETYSYDANKNMEISQILLLLNSLFEFQMTRMEMNYVLPMSMPNAPQDCGKWENSENVPWDILKGLDTLPAKRKLNLIFRSKSIEDPPVKIGDLVQFFIKLQNEKRDSWKEAKTVIRYSKSSGIVAVPASKGKKVNTSVEDVRFSITEDVVTVK